MSKSHPGQIIIDWDLAISLLRLVDGLAKNPKAPGLSYSEDGPFEYAGEPIPEADRLRARLMDALNPGFTIGDKVRSQSMPGKVGTVVHMVLFGPGWYVGVEWPLPEGNMFHDGTDLTKVAE